MVVRKEGGTEVAQVDAKCSDVEGCDLNFQCRCHRPKSPLGGGIQATIGQGPETCVFNKKG